MADPIDDQAEDGFHEIQLSGKQLVFLFMLTTVVLVVTFLSGVLVGRAVGTEDPAPDETTVAAGQASESLDLSEPTPSQPLDAHDGLQGDKAAGIKPPDTPDPAPPPPDPVPETPVPEPESKPDPSLERKPEPARPEPKAADVATSGRPGTWFLQVSALTSRSSAADMVRELTAKGYPAYLQEPGRGDRYFRVRIGRYRDRTEAEGVAARLKKQEDMAADIRRN